jgi:NAD(P)-dependent dehydrogenase (short-subunit alcohol dehydrogenase family)
MSWTFMPLLLSSSDPRLIFVSGLGTFGSCAKGNFPLPPDLEAGWPKKTSFETVGYRCSKTALNMLMLDYHWKLQKDSVKVWSVGPGFLTTDLGGMKELSKKMGTGHPSIGGDFLRTVVEGERDADVGKYVVKGGIMEF